MKRVLVDFDGTIIKKNTNGKFIMHNGSYQALKHMKANGYEIVVFTSRLADSSSDRNNVNKAIISRYLEKNKIPFDRITGEKENADYYIDDKAIKFQGNWDHVMEEMEN